MNDEAGNGLADVLARTGLFNAEQIVKLLAERADRKKPLIEQVIEASGYPEEKVLSALGSQLGMSCVLLREDDLDLYRQVLVTLERRAALLAILGQALDPRRAFVRVGGELEHPALQDAALVGATYGLTNRALGAVGLLGPARMDYDKAIRSVRAAARELSRFVEEVYEDN